MELITLLMLVDYMYVFFLYYPITRVLKLRKSSEHGDNLHMIVDTYKSQIYLVCNDKKVFWGCWCSIV